MRFDRDTLIDRMPEPSFFGEGGSACGGGLILAGSAFAGGLLTCEGVLKLGVGGLLSWGRGGLHILGGGVVCFLGGILSMHWRQNSPPLDKILDTRLMKMLPWPKLRMWPVNMASWLANVLLRLKVSETIDICILEH